jgi:hypothetical protein
MLLVGTGHQMFLYDTIEEPASSSNIASSQHGGNLFEIVASHNGPLEDHHPQMLLQCLLWGRSYGLNGPVQVVLTQDACTGKIDLVKEIIVRLAVSFDVAESAGSESLYFTRLSPWQFLSGHTSYVSTLDSQTSQ